MVNRPIVNIFGKLNYALFLALLIALPLPRMILQPIAVAFIIAWVLELRFLPGASSRSNGRSGLRLEGSNFPFSIFHFPLALPGLLLVCLTLWEAISLLWAPDTQAGLSIINRHWPFIILVLIPLFGFNEHYRTSKVLPALFASCVASVPLYLFTYYWVWNYDAVIWFRPDLIRPFEFPTFHGFTSLMKLRSYYCLVLMLSMLSTPLLYRQYLQRYPRWEVLVTLGVGNAVMLAGILMSGSRSALLSLAVTAIFLLFVNYRKRLRWYWSLLIVLVGLSVGIAGVVLNPRFALLSATDIHNLNLSEANQMNEPRPFLWATALRHIDEYGLFGLGAGQHANFMLEQYREAGNDYFLTQGFGPHSQYLSTWMCLGPLAVLLLLAVFVLIPRVYRGRARYSAHAVAFLFALSLLFDDLLERMDSILIFLVWMLLLYIIETDPES